MMRSFALFVFLLLLLTGSRLPGLAQKISFQHYTLSDARLGDVQVHLLSADTLERKPLLVYLDGSGNYPIYYKTASGRYSTSVPADLQRYAKQFHVVLISKPGIPFADSLSVSPSGRTFYPENNTYTRLYSLGWRAEAASKAIDFIAGRLPVKSSTVLVIGYSEGSQVAPRVAVLNKKVTHLVCIGGNCLNQLYDFLIDARLAAERGEISATEGQAIVDSLYKEYEQIYAAPASVADKWYGATYLKWSSFAATTPLENMLRLDIPILYIASGKDENQTIIDMDYARLEFMRQGKKNLRYMVYPECNHYFQERQQGTDGSPKMADRIDEVHQRAIEWALGL